MRVSNIGWKITALLSFTLLCVLTFVYLYQSAGGRLPWYDPFKAQALVPEPLNLVANSDVRKDGVKIGRVATVEPEGTDSLLELEIDDDKHQTIYRDATIRVRTKTLVGESYIDIDPGTPGEGRLPEGAGLPLRAATEVVPLERILSLVDEKTRNDIRGGLRGIGGGLEGRGADLNRLFGAIPPTVSDGGRLMEALAPQKRQLATLIDNTGEVLGAFGQRTQDLRTMITAAKATAEAVAVRDDKLRESLDELPSTLSQARQTVGNLNSFSASATPVFGNLRSAASQLSPTIRELSPAARDGRELFRELPDFLDKANPLLDELRPASDALSKVVPGVDATLRQLNPALRYLKPFAPELSSFFASNGEIFRNDALGTTARVHAMFSDRAFTGYPQVLKDFMDALTDVGPISEFFNPEENPYPKPGTVGNEQRFDGKTPKVTADP